MDRDSRNAAQYVVEVVAKDAFDDSGNLTPMVAVQAVPMDGALIFSVMDVVSVAIGFLPTYGPWEHHADGAHLVSTRTSTKEVTMHYRPRRGRQNFVVREVAP